MAGNQPPVPQQVPQQQPAQQQGWLSVIKSYLSILGFVATTLWNPVRYLIFKNISHTYSDVMAISLILLLSYTMYYYRRQLSGPLRWVVFIVLLLAVTSFMIRPPSADDIGKELARHSVGNNFGDFSSSLLNETHRIYGFFGRSGTGKTNIAEKAAEVSRTMLNRQIDTRVFFLHNNESKDIEDFFNVGKPGSLAGWVTQGGGCSREKCFLILDDLHLMLDYYYEEKKQPEKVNLFFNKLQAFVRSNPRVVVIMVIEITAFGRVIRHPRITYVASNEELQRELKESNSVFCRLGDEYLSVFFKEVHHNYGRWKAAMQVHLDELVHNTILLSQAQTLPFDKGTRIEFDESVFEKSRTLVQAFKDVKKFFLPRLYWKLVDPTTPRDCTPDKGRRLTVYAKGDFVVKCEPCLWCKVLDSEAWQYFKKWLGFVSFELLWPLSDTLKVLLRLQ